MDETCQCTGGGPQAGGLATRGWGRDPTSPPEPAHGESAAWGHLSASTVQQATAAEQALPCRLPHRCPGPDPAMAAGLFSSAATRASWGRTMRGRPPPLPPPRRRCGGTGRRRRSSRWPCGFERGRARPRRAAASGPVVCLWSAAGTYPGHRITQGATPFPWGNAAAALPVRLSKSEQLRQGFCQGSTSVAEASSAARQSSSPAPRTTPPPASRAGRTSFGISS